MNIQEQIQTVFNAMADNRVINNDGSFISSYSNYKTVQIIKLFKLDAKVNHYVFECLIKSQSHSPTEDLADATQMVIELYRSIPNFTSHDTGKIVQEIKKLNS